MDLVNTNFVGEHLTLLVKSQTGEKLYEYKQSGRAFTHFGCFQENKKTHTTEKLYECLECGKTFISLANIGRHVHNGDAPY